MESSINCRDDILGDPTLLSRYCFWLFGLFSCRDDNLKHLTVFSRQINKDEYSYGVSFCRKARQLSSQKPMAARGHVNGRGPAKLGGMSEAKVFD
jgi:hypothetical protein